MKPCPKCKAVLANSYFYRHKTQGLSFYCKKCHSQSIKEYNKANPGKVKAKRRTLSHRFSQLKSGAKRRNIEVAISYIEYAAIVGNGTCSYCQGSLPEAGHGIDRIDNSIGYTRNNVKACCQICNRMKSDLSEQDFLNHIKAIGKAHDLS